MASYNILSIDLEAVRKNIILIREALPSNVRLLAMVKAECYGTHAKEMAKFYIEQGIDIVGVSHVQEGVNLREAFPNLAIFVINAPLYDVEAAVGADLEIALSDRETALALNKAAIKCGKKVRVHLDINTGMHRFGCREEDALSLALEIKRLSNLEIAALMTHFIASENKEFDSFTHTQIAHFEKKVLELQKAGVSPPWRHAADSAAALRHSIPFCNMVRVGFALFGFKPENAVEWNLNPAFTLETRIQGINHCKAGESVGYSASYRAHRKEERIAILPVGYYDGFKLNYSGRGYVLIHGKKAPFVSRICMDFMMVDITDIPEAKVGDRVIFFDKKPPLTLDECAGFIQTNPRELLVSLGPRVKRRFLPCLSEAISLRF